MKVNGLGVCGVDLKGPFAVGRLPKLFDDRGVERRERRAPYPLISTAAAFAIETSVDRIQAGA